MRTLRLSAILALGLAFSYGLAEASDNKTEGKKEGHKAKCCLKAEKEGKKCGHGCCVEQAKDGKNCEKCGGKN